MKKNWIKLLTFLLGILISDISYGQVRVYNNDKTFSFIPLDNWENFSKDNELTFAQPLDNVSDIFRENIKISVSPANGMKLDELWNSYVLIDFPKSFENFKIIQMWNSKINEKDVKWIEFTNYKSEIKFRSLIYMLVENDKMYFIVCLALDIDFEKTEKSFLEMVNSFETN